MNNQQPHKSNPPYLLGLLGLIPLLGVFVGIALILYGIIKYRSEWLVAIGIGCIAFTFLVYSSLLYYTKSSGILDKSSQYLTKKELYELTRDIEFYRLVYGHYPDSLSDLLVLDSNIMIQDIVITLRNTDTTSTTFFYQKNGAQYILKSKGMDRKINTKDDLYPEIKINDSSHIGLVKEFR